MLNICFSNSLTATKCQNQRLAAIERYRRKFLQVFNTFPSHLSGALHDTSRKSEGNIESQGETGGGGHGEAGRTEAGRDGNGGRQRNRERYWLKYSPDNN